MVEELPQTDPFWKSFNLKYLVLGFFLLGLFVFSIGFGLLFFKKSTSSSDIQIISAQSNGEVGEIMVHVDGAVKAPGLYKIKADARIHDAIVAAGGLTSDADSQKINLAAKVSDGMKVHIPSRSEIKAADPGSAGSVASEVWGGLININSASQAELEKLPGIGPVTAQKIISSRPYSSVDELLGKKVVSSKVYSQIKDLVTN